MLVLCYLEKVATFVAWVTEASKPMALLFFVIVDWITFTLVVFDFELYWLMNNVALSRLGEIIGQ